MTNVRLIAFYLPQFHPIEENDNWWGKGFTEWTNVSQAVPLYSGHYQPHIPSELGFYDLRLNEVRQEQESLAAQYGVDGFCYYYYWFSGKRLLELPLENKLSDRDSQMPFCLCWCNENWTRSWNSGERDVLMEQKYAPDDPQAFIDDLTPFLTDERYIKVDGNPMLLVYRAQEIPNVLEVVKAWRQRCRENGIGELHLCAVLTYGNKDYRRYGFDSGVEFPPHNRNHTNVQCINRQVNYYRPFKGFTYLYHELAEGYLAIKYDDPLVYKCVFPSWDNTARNKDRALLIHNGTPENYEYWLTETLQQSKSVEPAGQRFVFVNAWNEWAEGCHLEPDIKYKREFLAATRRAKSGESCLKGFVDKEVPDPGDGHGFFGTLAELIKSHFFIFVAKIQERMQTFLYRHEKTRGYLKMIYRWIVKKL